MRLDEEQKQLVRGRGYPIVQETERDDEEGYIEYRVWAGTEISGCVIWFERVEFGQKPSHRAGGRAFRRAAEEQAAIAQLCVKILGGGRL